MKRLPLHHRPFFAKRVLEIGGGHAPYAGVTHAVDKYPDDDSQRAASLVLPSGVEFKQGDLEAIPFDSEPKFDFLYTSHVLEHVQDPARAVAEINRVARRGYIETPSPLREQVAAPLPFDPAGDFHTFFCWASPATQTLHVARKSERTLGDFCVCADGRLARRLFELKTVSRLDVEPLLPRAAKTTRLYFRAPVRLRVHSDLAAACREGSCAYGSAEAVRRWTSFPRRWFAKRFRELGRFVGSRAP